MLIPHPHKLILILSIDEWDLHYTVAINGEKMVIDDSRVPASSLSKNKVFNIFDVNVFYNWSEKFEVIIVRQPLIFPNPDLLTIAYTPVATFIN